MYVQIGKLEDGTVISKTIYSDSDKKISTEINDPATGEKIKEINKYDNKDRIIRTDSSDGYWVTYSYGKDGITTQVDSVGDIRKTYTDNIIKCESNDTQQFDDKGNLISIKIGNKTIFNKYDDKNRLVEKIDLFDRKILYHYFELI